MGPGVTGEWPVTGFVHALTIVVRVWFPGVDIDANSDLTRSNHREYQISCGNAPFSQSRSFVLLPGAYIEDRIRAISFPSVAMLQSIPLGRVNAGGVTKVLLTRHSTVTIGWRSSCWSTTTIIRHWPLYSRAVRLLHRSTHA
jgi:hypothetical protein